MGAGSLVSRKDPLLGTLWTGSGRVVGSMGPRFASGGRFSSSVPGGCTGSYSSVASFPASFNTILLPPGCDGRKDVTS